MRILAVTAEMFPFVKTGGLADAAGALPDALERLGADVRTLLPGYRKIRHLFSDREPQFSTKVLGQQVSIYELTAHGQKLFILDAPHLFDRDGSPYGHNGQAFTDNDLRYAVLSKAASLIALGAIEDWKPDLVHAHDWHAALSCVYLADAVEKIPTVLTLHNLAFQGQYSLERADDLELPQHRRTVECLEYYGDMSFLKAGLITASAITTVSQHTLAKYSPQTAGWECRAFWKRDAARSTGSSTVSIKTFGTLPQTRLSWQISRRQLLRGGR